MAIITTYTQPEEILCDIFRKQMNLATDQVDPNFGNINPQDMRLYITVSMIDSKEIGGEVVHSVVGGNLQESIKSNISGMFSVNIFSFTNEAIQRRYEPLLALKSNYARQIMDVYRIRIPEYSLSFVQNNEPAGDSISILNRYTATIRVNYSYNSIENIDYYNTINSTLIIEN